jgi:hypothetical protein
MPVLMFRAKRIPRPITDARLMQAYAAEEILDAMLDDLYKDVRAGAPVRAFDYALVMRHCPPRAVSRVPVPSARRTGLILEFPRRFTPGPITDARLEQAHAAESLLDAILEDLYEDLKAGTHVSAVEYRLVWRHRPPRAIDLMLTRNTG